MFMPQSHKLLAQDADKPTNLKVLPYSSICLQVDPALNLALTQLNQSPTNNTLNISYNL